VNTEKTSPSASGADHQPTQGQTDLSRFNNDWYVPGPRWKVLLWYFINALLFNSYAPVPTFAKVATLRLFGAKVGRGLVIKPAVNIKYPWLLTIGHHVWIGEGVWIDNLTHVALADHCCVSQGAMLLTGNHDYKRPTFDLMVGRITLEAGAWVGARATVCPGVQVGSHAILAVGSVATHHLEPYTIYQGNPAVAVRKRAITDKTPSTQQRGVDGVV
jgi:putative colanic acid biosynthesis acetyltransferase WcaF